MERFDPLVMGRYKYAGRSRRIFSHERGPGVFGMGFARFYAGRYEPCEMVALAARDTETAIYCVNRGAPGKTTVIDRGVGLPVGFGGG